MKINHLKQVGLMCVLTLCTQSVQAVKFAEGVEFNGLAQGWIVNDTTSTTDAKLNTRIRRAELKFSGSVAENTRYFVMFDPAKSPSLTATGDNKVLQDLGLGFSLTPELEFLVGQFKMPTTAEGLEGSGDLIFAERSMGARAYGDRRDPGAELIFKQSQWKLMLMASNGQGPNANDTTNKKDLALRVEGTPIEALNLGAFTQAGDFSYQSKARWGANFAWNQSGFTFRGEGVLARDSGVRANAVTVDFAYKVNDQWQPAVRYDRYRLGGTTGQAPTLGLNYFIKGKNSRVTANYTLLDNVAGNVGSPAISSGTDGSMFVLAFQGSI